jgi:hypothetical protein
MNKLIMVNEPPNGLLFHSSAPIEGGWQVIDFWESRQAYDAAMPVVQKAIESAGASPQGPPRVEEFAVHEMFRPWLRGAAPRATCNCITFTERDQEGGDRLYAPGHSPQPAGVPRAIPPLTRCLPQITGRATRRHPGANGDRS